MLTLFEQVLFVILVAVSFAFAYRGFKRVIGAIAAGQGSTYYPRTDRLPRRIGRAVAVTLGQQTVFRDRPWVSLFHSLVFYGFVFYLLVNIIDALKGYVPQSLQESLDLGVLAGLYRFAADLLTMAVLIGIVYLLIRRFVARDTRLDQRNPETLLHERVREGAIRRDSLIVAIFILLHVGFRLTGETFLLAAEGHWDPFQPFASSLAILVGYGEGRIVGWHVGWWGALGLILAFLPYFPRSKHIHLFGAPANFALERRREDGSPLPRGALEPIDFESEELEQFGAAKLEHLRWPQLLDAYACIQCNRCTNVCPANVTGKTLSPAALEINKRYEVNLVADALAAGEETPRTLTDFAISPESLWACTACGACMEVCPVGCTQMIDIIDIRRDQVMMQGEFPAELQTAFRGMERSGNPWGIGQDKRLDWAKGLDVPTLDPEKAAENPDFDVLFWVGCAGSYDPSAQQTTRAMARILEHAGIDYVVLGKGEKCTGDPARRAGNEYLYYQLASENVATLDALNLNNRLLDETLDPAKRKRVVTTCPHCFNALFNDYPQLGGDYDVLHHSQLIEELIDSGRLPPVASDESITFHDPCYLGRNNGIYDSPRRVLESGGTPLIEMDRSRNKSFCCGAGGAQFWKEEEPGEMRVSENRFREAKETGAAVVATGCPFCRVMLGSSDSASEEDAPEVRDIALIVADRLERIDARLSSDGTIRQAPAPRNEGAPNMTEGSA
ncbi:MAG: (Fe-S)-binding protein [Trueperaceae bacterium]